MRIRMMGLLLLIAAVCTACAEPTSSAPILTLPPTATPPPTASPTPPPTPTPSAQDILAQGWEAFEEGDLKTAEEVANHLLELDNRSAGPWALLGAVEERRMALADALNAYQRAYNFGHEDLTLPQKLADLTLLLIRQNIDKIFTTYSYEEIDELIKDTKQHFSAYLRLPQQVQDMPEEFFSLLYRDDRANRYTSTKEAANIMDQGVDLLDQGYYKQSIRKFEASLAIDPKYPQASYFLGLAHYYLDENDTAIEIWKQIISQDPDLSYVYNGLGNAYAEINLPRHSHQAFVNMMLITDDFVQDPKEGLGYLDEVYSGWDHGLFNEYGFRFSLPPGYETNLIQTAEEGGIASLDTDESEITLAWSQMNEEAIEKQVNARYVVESMPDEFIFGSVTKVGPVKDFLYSDVEISYQQFMLKVNTIDQQMLGVYAAWICDETVFVLNQFFQKPSEEIKDSDERLSLYSFAYLESVSCEIDGDQPTVFQGFPVVQFAGN